MFMLRGGVCVIFVLLHSSTVSCRYCSHFGGTQVDSDIKKLWKDCGAKSKETAETVRKALEAHALVSPLNLEP